MLPKGGKVASGSASISQSGAQTNITQSSQTAIINWQDFSIGEGNTVKVVQPNTTSALLNRVTGKATSTLAGTLTANGRVYLINPNGIAITSTGKVQAQAFTASTLDISDADFKAGKLDFTGKGSSASVSNAGTISVASGGYVALMGGSVSNSGLIVAPLGKVGLGSGEAMTLDVSGDGFLQVAVPTQGSGTDALVSNAGTIKAQGGSVVLTAAAARTLARQAVNLTGVIEATSVSGHNGAIRLSGGEGQVAVSGTVKATSDDASGGSITVTGRDIALGQASLDASGKTGGGTILIGGDAQGQGALAHAETVSIDAQSTLKANATTTGNGGNIIAWSDGQTTAHASFEAKAVTGQGGTVETSGAVVDFTGVQVDTSSSQGQAGTWLIDPTDLTVDAAAAATISSNLATTNVTLQTNADGTTSGPGNTSTGAGDITVNSAISWSSNKTLTLNAYHALKINAPINILGAGGLALAYDASDVMNLTFNGTGTVDYGATDQGGTLAINGANYTLIYNMDQLDAIDGLNAVDGSTVATYGLGLSGRYAMAQNLDASSRVYGRALIGYNLSPNATITEPSNFTGTFEGLGHRVSNLSITSTGTPFTGLFGVTNGTIRDFELANIQVSVSGATTSIGGMAAVNYGDMVNVSLSGQISAPSAYNVGGLTGVTNGRLQNAHVDATVAGFQTTGGLAAQGSGLIRNVYSTGRVTGNSSVGGLVGYSAASIDNAYSTVTVVASGANNSDAGGLVGYNSGTGSVTYAYSVGSVTGDNNIGGLVGTNAGLVSTTWTSSKITGRTNQGSFIGYNSGSVVNSYWTYEASGIGNAIGYSTNDQSGETHLVVDAYKQSSYTGWDFGNTWVMSDGNSRPFLISERTNFIQNVHQLQLMGMSLGSNYTLSRDIDASQTSLSSNLWRGGFIAIGTTNNPYYGTFEGNGHTISGLQIYGYAAENSGLFGVVGTIGRVQNVGLVSYKNLNRTSAFGALVGANYGTISNAFADGTISSNFSQSSTVGGLVGINYGTISDSHSSGSLISGGVVGGLVGQNGSASVAGTILRSYSTVDVSGSGDLGHTGGLVGRSVRGLVSQSFATGAVSGKYNVGGLVGLNEAAISQSFASGSVNGNAQVGGLVGSASWGTSFSSIDQSYAMGLVTGVSNAGGLAGYNSPYTTITNSYWNVVTSGRATGVGSDGANQAVTGLTSVQFQSGSLPANFDAMVWGTGSGLYPYLKPIFTTGVQAVKGFVYADLNNTTLAGQSVTVGTGGQILGKSGSGADGSYYLAVAAGSLALGYPKIVAYDSDGVTLVGGSGFAYTGIDIYARTLRGETDQLALSTAVPKVKSDALAAVGANASALQTAITATNSLWLDYWGPEDFSIDQPQSVTNALTVKTPLAGLSVDANLTVASGGTLNLLSGGALLVNADITAKGAATVKLQASSLATNLPLFFAQGKALTFTKADGSVATSDQGGKLNINTKAYGLVYNLSDFTALNYSTGLSALAHGLDASGNIYSGSLVGTFGGTFEGLGNTISHVTINGADTFTGLFGIVNAGAKVRDLTLDTATITSAGYSVGGLVGYNNGGRLLNLGLSNVQVAGAGNSHVGGLAGYNTGYISTVAAGAPGTVSGSGQYAGIGGLVGWNTSSGQVFNAVVNTSVTGTADNAFVGGLVGANNGGLVFETNAAGSITSNGWAVGGLVGYNLGTVTLGKSSMLVTGTGPASFLGGLVGVNAAGKTVQGSQFSGQVTGTAFAAGGIVGYNFGTVHDDAASGSLAITGDTYLGGLVGFNLGGIDTSNASASVSSTGQTSQIGGLVGQNFSGSITNAYATGTVTAPGANSFAGGLIGVNKAAVTSSYATGNVTSSGYTVGGLVGWNEATLTKVKYTLGTITAGANTHVGGIVGYNYGTIDQAYASGVIKSTGVNTGVGGLVGWQTSGSLTNARSDVTVNAGNAFVGGAVGVNFANIDSVLATGHVTGSGSFTGGLAGFNAGTIANGYYDYQTTGQAAGVQANGSQGIQTTTLQNGTLPTNFASSLWGVSSGQYPQLKALP